MGYPTIGFSYIGVSRSVHHPAYAELIALLLEARKGAGLRQAEVAQRLGRPQSFVSKFEKGERRLDVIELIALCNVLGVSPLTILQKVAATLEQPVFPL